MDPSGKLTDDEAVNVLSGSEFDASQGWTDAQKYQSSLETWQVI